VQAANNLLNELGRLVGLDGLALDESGQCTLAFDETIVLTFVGDADDSLNVVSYVGDLQAENAPAARALLSRNFVPSGLGGGRVALEPNSGRVVLVNRWDGVRTDFALFQKQLEEFVNSVESVRAELDALPLVAPSVGSSRHSSEVPPPGSFI